MTVGNLTAGNLTTGQVPSGKVPSGTVPSLIFLLLWVLLISGRGILERLIKEQAFYLVSKISFFFKNFLLLYNLMGDSQQNPLR
jgi:hypothetical protein